MIPQLLVLGLAFARILIAALVACDIVEFREHRPSKAVGFVSTVLVAATAQAVLYWGGFYDALIGR